MPEHLLRGYRSSDDEGIVRLFETLAPAERLAATMTLERWRAFGAAAHGGRDFHVAELEERIVGLLTARTLAAQVRRLHIIVDPGFRRRGIATSFLRIAEAQARAEGLRVLESFVQAASTAGCAFAEARGFEVFVHDLFLARGPEPFGAALPAGARVRAFERGGRDVETAATLANATLVRDRGFHTETAESVEGYSHAPGFALWFAEAPLPVGLCHLEARGSDGLVQALAVLGEWEGRGIGAALLAHGIETLRAAGCKRIELCTESDNVRAQRLYARAGFTLAREAFTLRRQLGPEE